MANDWIRHLDAKATVIFAAAGVSAGLLYNLVKGGTPGGLRTTLIAAACAVALLSAAGCSGTVLVPRVRSSAAARGDLPGTAAANSANPLFFGDVPGGWSDVDEFTDHLEVTIHSPAALRRLVGHQIWVNSHIATRKSAWAGRGVNTLIVALALLAITAGSAAIH